jgi:hypothetical protein
MTEAEAPAELASPVDEAPFFLPLVVSVVVPAVVSVVAPPAPTLITGGVAALLLLPPELPITTPTPSASSKQAIDASAGSDERAASGDAAPLCTPVVEAAALSLARICWKCNPVPARRVPQARQ